MILPTRTQFPELDWCGPSENSQSSVRWDLINRRTVCGKLTHFVCTISCLHVYSTAASV